MRFIICFLVFIFFCIQNFGFMDVHAQAHIDKQTLRQIRFILGVSEKELYGILELEISKRKAKVLYYLERKKQRMQKLKQREKAMRLFQNDVKKIGERVEKLKPRADIDTTLKSERFRLAGKEEKDISYWTQVLDSKDRDRSTYIVLPSQGLVVPVNAIKQGDTEYDSFLTGREIDVAPHLETGVLEIPGTSLNSYGEVGNKVIAGHSSYWTEKPGRYKTDFQKIIAADPGEQIWVYQKNREGKFKRYMYLIQKSYNTPATDTSILQPSKKSIITLFTCTPIGGISGRWVVTGDFVKVD